MFKNRYKIEYYIFIGTFIEYQYTLTLPRTWWIGNSQICVDVYTNIYYSGCLYKEQ